MTRQLLCGLAVLSLILGGGTASAAVVTGQTTGLCDLSSNNLGTGESNGTLASPKTFDATSDPASLNDIPWSNGSFSGTFDLSVVATGSGTNIGRGGRGAFGTTPGNKNLLNPGETIALAGLVASDFQGDLTGVSNLQFNAVYLGNGSENPPGVTINGVGASSFDTGGVTSAAGRNPITLANSALVTGGTSGDFSINGFDVTFDATYDATVLTTLFDDDFDNTSTGRLDGHGPSTPAVVLNAGVEVGSWSVGNDQESFIHNQSGDGTLLMDQGLYDFTANLAQDGTLSSTPVVSMEVELGRIGGANKNDFIDGYDADGKHLFSVRLDSSLALPNTRNLVAYSTDGTAYSNLTGLGLYWTQAQNAPDLGEFRTLEITLSPSGWNLWFDANDDGLRGSNGVEVVTGLSFIDSAPAGLDRIEFTGESLAGAYFNEILVTQVQRIIPEPSTFALATLGLLGLVFCGRRRKR